MGAVYEAIPLFGGQSTLNVGAADAVAQHAIDYAGIEIVAGADGADRLCGWRDVFAAQPTVRKHHRGTCPVGVDKALAVERNLCVVSLVGTVYLIHHVEVVAAATHYVGEFEVLYEVGSGAHHVVLVRGAEVNVVVDDGATATRIFEQPLHLRAHGGVDGVERAEEHDVVGLYVGEAEVEVVVLRVAIEHVVGLVALVEKRQRHGRLAPWQRGHVVGVDAVVAQKLFYVFAHAVVACL